LQDAVRTCNAVEGAEKSARFLAQAFAPTPLGVTLKWLLDELGRLRAPYAHEQRTPTLILAAVAREFGVGSTVIISPSRSHELLIPRQTAMYLMRTLLKLSLADIGEACGHRDHATVINSLERALQRMRASAPYAEIVARLEAQLRSTLVGGKP
jgi:chromosomal replication initiation ATPase DnaA